MKLKNGGEIIVRCFGRYNSSLWDDVFAELPLLTDRDVVIVNFGAWYPRFNFNEPRVGLPQPIYMPKTLLCNAGSFESCLGFAAATS